MGGCMAVSGFGIHFGDRDSARTRGIIFDILWQVAGFHSRVPLGIFFDVVGRHGKRLRSKSNPRGQHNTRECARESFRQCKCDHSINTPAQAELGWATLRSSNDCDGRDHTLAPHADV